MAWNIHVTFKNDGWVQANHRTLRLWLHPYVCGTPMHWATRFVSILLNPSFGSNFQFLFEIRSTHARKCAHAYAYCIGKMFTRPASAEPVTSYALGSNA